MVCLIGNCAACPDWVITLAVIGGALIYFLIGALVFAIVKSFKEDLDWDIIIAFIIFWPLIIAVAIVGAIGYYIFRLIAMPIIGADKWDLKQLEGKVDTKIAHEDNKIKDYLKYEYKPAKKERGNPEKSVKGKSSKKGKKRSKK